MAKQEMDMINQQTDKQMRVDITNQRFGNLMAIEWVDIVNGQSRWLCKCDCGKTKIAVLRYLRNGKTTSCGCKKGLHSIKHGMRKTRLYEIWAGMKKRCFSQNAINYNDYGARGITICDEWMQFEPFMKWALENGYSDELTIDRIDVNGDYCPENCRWTSMQIQGNNRRNNHLIEYNGETHSLSDWSRILGIKNSTLWQRLHKGWTVEDAFTIPLLKPRSGTKNVKAYN